MSLNAFALIILAGLIHAVWNIAAKKAGGDARCAGFTAVLMMLAVVVVPSAEFQAAPVYAQAARNIRGIHTLAAGGQGSRL